MGNKYAFKIAWDFVNENPNISIEEVDYIYPIDKCKRLNSLIKWCLAQ